MIGDDVTTPVNCQVETVLQLLSGYVAFAAASLLIVLRVIAIWNGNKLPIALASGVWVANLGFLAQSVVRIRAVWVPAMSTCVISNIHSTKLNMISTLITDVVLLLVMLIGLLRLGFHESGVYGLGHLMWRQGLVWLFLATIAEVPPVVFISLDLNDPFNYVFQIPAMITMSIAATRIYRSLADFSMNFTDFASVRHNLPPSGFTTSKTKRDLTLPVPSEPVEVAMHNIYEQSQTPKTNQHISCTSQEGPPRDKLTRLGFDDESRTLVP